MSYEENSWLRAFLLAHDVQDRQNMIAGQTEDILDVAGQFGMRFLSSPTRTLALVPGLWILAKVFTCRDLIRLNATGKLGLPVLRGYPCDTGL